MGREGCARPAMDAMLVVVVSGTRAPETLETAFKELDVATTVVHANDLVPATVKAAPGCILTGSRKWPDTQADDAVVRAVMWLEQYGVPTMAMGQAHEAIASLFGGRLVTALTGARTPRITLVFEGGSSEEEGLTGEYMVTSGREVIGAPIGWEPKVRSPASFNRSPIEVMYRANGKDSMISLSFRPELSGFLGTKWIVGISTRCGLYKPRPTPAYTPRSPSPGRFAPNRYIKTPGGRTAAEWQSYLERSYPNPDSRRTNLSTRFDTVEEIDDKNDDDLDFDLFGDDNDRAVAPTPDYRDGSPPPGFWDYGANPADDGYDDPDLETLEALL